MGFKTGNELLTCRLENWCGVSHLGESHLSVQMTRSIADDKQSLEWNDFLLAVFFFHFKNSF
jgi:hypothetical protein